MTMATAGIDVLPLPPAPAEGADESALTAEILHLWAAEQKTHATARRTREELSKQRMTLGAKLRELKDLLARRGRAGEWSGFLRANRLPRTTADRWIDRYERSLLPQEKRTTGAIGLPPEERAAALARTLLPRLRRILVDHLAVARFYETLGSAIPEDGFGVAHPTPAGGRLG
jgi:hypothetical protein